MSVRSFRAALFAGALTTALFAAACGGGSEVASSKIFKGPVWKGAEENSYRVTNKGIDGEGVCRFVTPAALEGMARFERNCIKDQFVDTGSVEADVRTLQPKRADRVNADTKKGDSVTHTIAYEATSATFTTDDGRKSRSTTRDLPRPSTTSPDPGWYDDDSLFWLARGLPLQQGWTGGYTHVINAGQPRVLPVEVRVEAPETVEVPAGKFQAWRVRFQRGNTVHVLWVETQAPNRVVRAQIEDVRFELTGTK